MGHVADQRDVGVIDPVTCIYLHAERVRKDGRLAAFVKNRYASWDSGIGAKIEAGKASFKDLEAYMLKQGDASSNVSGRQEFLENLINEFI